MQELTGGRGVDYAFEVIGLPETTLQAYNMIRKGGTAVMVGMTRAEAQVTIPTFDLFFNEKTLKGCKYGSGQVRRDFQRFADLIETGRLDTVVDGVADDQARRGQRRLHRDGEGRSHPQRHHLVLTGCADRQPRADRACGRGSTRSERPDQLAYVMAAPGEAVTYRELNDRSNQLAQLFCDAGLRFGDHIAVLMENRPEYFEPCWAAQRSGLFYTCINWHFNADEVAYILDDCDAQVLVVSDAFRDVAAELVDKMPNVKVRLMVGDATVDGYEPYEAARDALSRPSRSRRSSRARGCSTRRARRAGPKGVQVQDRAPARRRAAARDGDDHGGVGHGRARRLPVARAAVPLGAALLLHEHDAPRRHRAS